MACNYVAWALGLLDKAKEEQLDATNEAGRPTWREHVESQLQIDRTFIRSVYALCSERMDEGRSLAFVLRGAGGDRAEKRFLECM